MSPAWIAVAVAGVLETAWAIGLKYSNGFTELTPSLFTLGALVSGMYLLSFASKSISIGTAYSVWVGLGTLGTALSGIVLFGESASPLRLLFLSLLLIAVVGLKVTGG